MKQRIEIPALAPGLNGGGGLKRMHWTKYRELRDYWYWLVREQNPKKHSGAVKITYTRCSSRQMDHDNIAASFKLIGDALEALGVIRDDSPGTIKELSVKWEKVKRKDKKTVIEIEDV